MKNIPKYCHKYQNRLSFLYTHSDIFPMVYFTRIRFARKNRGLRTTEHVTIAYAL